MHAIITGHDREHLLESAPFIGGVYAVALFAAMLIFMIVLGVVTTG